jgi:cellulose synthase/poly-beta-1,6-N-acetylglucosamine synthase-like glycosyltransferase
MLCGLHAAFARAGNQQLPRETGMILAWQLYALFIVLFILFGLASSLANFFTVRRFDQYPPAEKYPFVSVLVPARNEANNIEVCVISLLAQDYPDFELLVLNDNSTDDTSLILEQLARSDGRLRVIQGAPFRMTGWESTGPAINWTRLPAVS